MTIDFSRNIDKQGYIVQTNMDAGDSASRTGIYYYLAHLLGYERDYLGRTLSEGLKENLKGHEVTTGEYIRHPVIPGNHYPNGLPVQSYVTDPKEMSRDNMNPLIIAMGEYPEQESVIVEWEMKQISRDDVYQNNDIMGPQDYGMYIRARKAKPLYWVLPICDLGLLVTSLIRVYKRNKDPSDTSDDVLHSLMILQASKVFPTPISWLARVVYNLSRPIDALKRYFSLESGAPPLWEMYEEAGKGILK